jgi:hypothetical protein
LTIEIDDAGTGDPLLGAVVGFYRRETDEFHFEWIPIEAYQEGTYTKDLPQEECGKAVMRGLLAMNIKPEEQVLLCQGSIFDKAREALDAANIPHEPLKVEGKLQDAVEEEYVKAVEALGIRSPSLRIDPSEKDKGYKKRYFILLNWARKRKDEREKYVKNALTFWKYSKEQQRPIPGGWKKARKDFEDALEAYLKENGENLTWNNLQQFFKSNFSQDQVLVNKRASIEPGTEHVRNNQTMRIQVYNRTLAQMYIFLGKGFPEDPAHAAWKAVLWRDDGQAVNGVMFYVARDEYYRYHTRWIAFLRPNLLKLLGTHVRVGFKPF